MKVLDADGVELWSSHCLARITCVSVGPNYLWHIDGYDKIKPYGFAVHGAIDGFSMKILWLGVASSNKIQKQFHRIIGLYQAAKVSSTSN